LFIRGGNSKYILDSDVEDIKAHFQIQASKRFRMLGIGYAENPIEFYQK
jgi:hypothetical protein